MDELENQVLLYRYSIRRENPDLSEDELRSLLRNKVNRKFQEKNKKILREMMNSHLNFLNSTGALVGVPSASATTTTKPWFWM